MAEPASNLAKASLIELESDFEHVASPGERLTVQFNPETLKVSFANQIVQPSGGADQRGTQGRQFVGAGTTKLTLTLWFDVTAPISDETSSQRLNDVRQLTKRVTHFITPKKTTEKGKDVWLPPGVRFLWGSFQFDGMLDSLEESLEFFSPDGRPLRASMGLAFSQQKIDEATFKLLGTGGGAGGPGTPSTPGTRPLARSTQGATIQALADARGVGGDWRQIAAANGIENPRRLVAGSLIDLQAGVAGGVGVGGGISGSARVGASARIPALGG